MSFLEFMESLTADQLLLERLLKQTKVRINGKPTVITECIIVEGDERYIWLETQEGSL